jgi:hypothetical protein
VGGWEGGLDGWVGGWVRYVRAQQHAFSHVMNRRHD